MIVPNCLSVSAVNKLRDDMAVGWATGRENGLWTLAAEPGLSPARSRVLLEAGFQAVHLLCLDVVSEAALWPDRAAAIAHAVGEAEGLQQGLAVADDPVALRALCDAAGAERDRLDPPQIGGAQ